MSEEELKALDSLYARATPGPWSAFVSGKTVQIDIGQPLGGRPCIVSWTGFDGNDLPLARNVRNASLIVALHNAFPALRDAALRTAELEREVEALRRDAELIYWEPCDKHRGLSWTATAIYKPPLIKRCPICAGGKEGAWPAMCSSVS